MAMDPRAITECPTVATHTQLQVTTACPLMATHQQALTVCQIMATHQPITMAEPHAKT